MTRDVVSVGPETTYVEIADALVSRRVSAVPVVDISGHVVGVVSEADLLPRLEVAGAEGRPPHGRQRAVARKGSAFRAAELMSTPPITIEADVPIATAARVLRDAHIKRLPVVTADRRLIGIVSRRDLLRTYTRPDAAIRHDVIEGVLRQRLSIDPTTVEVRVTDGFAVLDGEVATRSLAQSAATLTGSVPGVVHVVNRLRWAAPTAAPNGR
jgi:CBS domain-containing protein